MTDAKQGRGRPAKPGKTTFNFRISADLRQMLVAAAAKSGLSLTEEAELRLRRDFGWQAAKGDIEEMKRDAAKWADASRANAIRAAGLQILREITGKPTRVIVDFETLIAEADGILRGLRSGFFDENAPPAVSKPNTMTKEEWDQGSAKLDELKREIQAAQERTRAADKAAEEAAAEASIRAPRARAGRRR